MGLRRFLSTELALKLEVFWSSCVDVPDLGDTAVRSRSTTRCDDGSEVTSSSLQKVSACYGRLDIRDASSGFNARELGRFSTNEV